MMENTQARTSVCIWLLGILYKGVLEVIDAGLKYYSIRNSRQRCGHINVTLAKAVHLLRFVLYIPPHRDYSTSRGLIFAYL